MSYTSSLVTFVGNIARSAGGAVHFDTSNENVLIVKGTIFKDNSVLEGGGGAVSLMTSNRNMFVYSSTFQGNSARIGGAVYVGRANMIIQFSNTLFETNNAHLNGGAIYFSVNNGDGVLSSDSPTGMVVYYSSCIGNTALGSGGCIYAYQYNVLHIYFSTLSENYCGSNGGALYQNFGYLYTGGCKFRENTAGGGGGALYMEASQAYVLQPNRKLEFTVFENNTARYGGGAYLSLSSSLNTSGLTIFDSNRAIYGGAIRLLDSLVSFSEPVTKSFTEQVSYAPGTYYFRHIFEVENSRLSSLQILTSKFFILNIY
jgi:predicted outer membrane repeat protein